MVLFFFFSFMGFTVIVSSATYQSLSHSVIFVAICVSQRLRCFGISVSVCRLHFFLGLSYLHFWDLSDISKLCVCVCVCVCLYFVLYFLILARIFFFSLPLPVLSLLPFMIGSFVNMKIIIFIVIVIIISVFVARRAIFFFFYQQLHCHCDHSHFGF